MKIINNHNKFIYELTTKKNFYENSHVFLYTWENDPTELQAMMVQGMDCKLATLEVLWDCSVRKYSSFKLKISIYLPYLYNEKKEQPEVFYKKRCSQKFRKFHSPFLMKLQTLNLFHLISWYGNFVERQFPHQKIRWNYGILHYFHELLLT